MISKVLFASTSLKKFTICIYLYYNPSLYFLSYFSLSSLQRVILVCQLNKGAVINKLLAAFRHIANGASAVPVFCRSNVNFPEGS